MLEQHLALALVDAVQRGGQHHLGAGQVKAKGDLIGTGSARDMAGAAPETQGRRVGGDEPPAAPARHEAVDVGALDEPVV